MSICTVVAVAVGVGVPLVLLTCISAMIIILFVVRKKKASVKRVETFLSSTQFVS